MALSKNIETSFGVTASYHKIADINISWHKKECGVTIECYLNEQSRLDNKSPLTSFFYYYNEVSFDIDVEGNLTEQLYNKIKQESEFIDATDN